MSRLKLKLRIKFDQQNELTKTTTKFDIMYRQNLKLCSKFDKHN